MALALVAIACRAQSPDPSVPTSTVDTPLGPATLEQMTLPMDLRGISGLTPAGDGTFWAVPERDRRLFRIRVDDRAPSVEAVVPIRGAPPDDDLESVAVLTADPTELVFGCETTLTRTSDRVVKAKVDVDVVTVDTHGSAKWSVEYAPWAVTPMRNRGLEALCIEGRRMLAASETVKEVSGRRLAPVAIRSLDDDGPWVARSLQLTSKEGKISAVACRAGDGGRLETIAVERHFGVMRVLRFTVDPGDADTDPLATPIVPELLVDLSAAYPRDPPPNFEGLAWVDERTMLLISDNDYRGVSGPTTLLRIRLPKSPSPGR